jgi:hypothetical protein
MTEALPVLYSDVLLYFCGHDEECSQLGREPLNIEIE